MAKPIRKFGTAILLLAGLLAGCQTTAPDATSRSTLQTRPAVQKQTMVFPEPLYQWGLARGLAEQIADNCRAYRFNHAHARSELRRLETQLRADGYTESDFGEIADDMPVSMQHRIQRDAIAFIEAHNIVITVPQTFCPAGQREIANNTRIGQFLIAR